MEEEKQVRRERYSTHEKKNDKISKDSTNWILEIAVTKNNLIYSKGSKKITDIHSDKLTHFLRYKNDSLMISYKTLNKDNPKLNCRLDGLSKFSPKRIILDNNLKTNTNTYVFKTANKKNTIIFYKKADKVKI